MNGIGAYGVWTNGPVRATQAVELERLGYRALWVGGSPSENLEFAEPLLDATQSIVLATGVVNVWTTSAEAVADSYHRVEQAFPGRLLLGVGIGHPERDQRYASPYETLVRYLDALDRHGVPQSARVVAALGPRVTRLARERCAGAHPYLTTPAHTRNARAILGRDALLAPEHKVVLSTNVDQARAVGRQTVNFYQALINYRTSWKRLGFDEDDVALPGSDRLIDSLVAHGSADSVAAQLREHLDAGADHVAIQVLGGWERLMPTLTELAVALGLSEETLDVQQQGRSVPPA